MAKIKVVLLSVEWVCSWRMQVIAELDTGFNHTAANLVGVGRRLGSGTAASDRGGVFEEGQLEGHPYGWVRRIDRPSQCGPSRQ